jgi:hypothetical protein
MKPEWNEVVLAYERELELLEEARAAYDAACRATIDAVSDRAKSVLAARALSHSLDLEFSWDERDDEPGAKFARWEILKDGTQWAQMGVWVSSAHGGDPHTIRTQSILVLPDGVLPESTQELLIGARKQLGAGGHAPKDVDEGWLCFGSVNALEDDAVANTVKMLSDQLDAIAPLIATWHEKALPAIKTRAVLGRVKEQLLKMKLVPDQRVSPASKKVPCMRNEDFIYLGLCCEGEVEVRVGTVLGEGALWVGIDRRPDDHIFATALAQAIGLKLEPEEASDEHVAGILMNPPAVLEASEDLLFRRVMDTFTAWAEHVRTGSRKNKS